jgi:hypothetical protein
LVSRAKELRNENRDFHFHSSAPSFHNVASSGIHDFVQSLASRTAAPFEQRRRAARGHAQAFLSRRSLVGAVRGLGEPLHLTQTEDVEYKLDGLLLLIEGKSTSADGKVLFSALATITYDDASHTYRFRGYNDGHYLDTDLTVPTNGFSWSFTSGPAHIVNTMHLTGKGEWDEVTDVTVGSNPPHRSVEMHLSTSAVK